eukprot:c3339_g1_i2.p1 GENE.c3339_g1_i2~~c3339_g1_i2.p1  ORF type:complete len:511 (+),score=155.24 c3339_g1_i2:69-1535(+)
MDGALKLENMKWKFDFAFDETVPSSQVYEETLQPLINSVFAKNSKLSMFAYGQTGAGKSYTMLSVFQLSVQDMFENMNNPELFQNLSLSLNVSFYEVYQGKVFDLLANRNQLDVLEDGDGNINLRGIVETTVENTDQVLELLNIGQQMRATRATDMNDTSSRSHAVLILMLRHPDGSLHGQLTLIDLAGSEKGADTPSSDKKTRNEAAEINKSLLALKECIRALGNGSSHAPFRSSKLTMLLRDALTDPKSLAIMVACVSPGFFHAEATLNTLRYAERLKAVGADTGLDELEEEEAAPTPPPKMGAASTGKGATTPAAASSKAPAKTSAPPPAAAKNSTATKSAPPPPAKPAAAAKPASTPPPAAAPPSKSIKQPSATPASPASRTSSFSTPKQPQQPAQQMAPPQVVHRIATADVVDAPTDMYGYMLFIGIPEEDAKGYTSALAKDGFDDADSLHDITEAELITDYAVKKGHARKLARKIAMTISAS